MRCSNCGTENPAGKKFCAQCGSRLPALCPSCGGENLESSRFCGDCGAALPGNTPPAPAKSRKAAPTAPDVRVAAEQTNPPSASDGERKTITVLFADIKGSMSQIEDLDPEAARAVVDPALAIMAEAGNRYQGPHARSTRQCACSRDCSAIRTGCAPTAKRRSRFASGSTPARS